MMILGMNFGHDASLALLEDGRVRAFWEKERFTRVKHSLGLSAEDVSSFLSRCGVAASAIDHVAVSSTQMIEYLFFDPAQLGFSLDEKSPIRSTFLDWHAKRGSRPKTFRTRILERFKTGEFASLAAAPQRRQGDWTANYLRPEWGRDPARIEAFPSLEAFLSYPEWSDPQRIQQGEWAKWLTPANAAGFHAPIKVNLLGRQVTGTLVSHHLSHAAYSHFSAGGQRSLIFSLDGAVPDAISYSSGMAYWADGNTIYPVFPHHLNLGHFYKQTAILLGFDAEGGDGKLMGLASYGKPEFFNADFAGTLPQQKRRLGVDGSAAMTREWASYLRAAVGQRGLDYAKVGVDPARVLSRETTSIAASGQKVFEHGMREAVAMVLAGCRRSGLQWDKFLLTGGCALNCPANSMIFRDFGIDNVEVLPGIIDAGLSIGAAMALHYSILQNPLPARAGKPGHGAYLGFEYPASEVEQALSAQREKVRWTRPAPEKYLERAVSALEANQIIAWYEGRSEIGPRALGHRSILVNPGVAANWPRVNEAKKREPWRPFAPAVLRERFQDFFFGGPADSAYMLFTHFVRSTQIPAVTHHDGTARVQTVDERSGRFFDLLRAWEARSGLPVLLNTSFNGPGEPIVETPADAIQCFLRQGLDVLFLDGCCVERLAA